MSDKGRGGRTPLSQEEKGAKTLLSIFWKGMKIESYDKTRFCVSREGLPNELGTFSSPWFMFENKTKNMFLTRRGSNIMEPGRQYIGAHQIFFPKNDSYVWIYLLSHKWSFIRHNLFSLGLVQLNKGFSMSHRCCLKFCRYGTLISVRLDGTVDGAFSDHTCNV